MPQISDFMEICPVGASLIHAGRWTDRKTEGHMGERIEVETDGHDEGVRCFQD
jgi:hypothetical protein